MTTPYITFMYTLVVNVYIVVHINCVYGIRTQNCVAAHGASTSKRGCRHCLSLSLTFCKVLFSVKICAKSHCDRGRYTWITAAALWICSMMIRSAMTKLTQTEFTPHRPTLRNGNDKSKERSFRHEQDSSLIQSTDVMVACVVLPLV